MIFKCKFCGGRTVFDIDKQLMRCQSCERLDESPEMVETEVRFDQYHCMNCGAQLAVNEDEVTTECPYCGEQSVIYDGKDDWFKPEYIVPFQVTRSRAMEIIKQEFEKYRFAPRQIREIDVESIRPVYIPFLIHSLKVYTKQKIVGEVNVIGEKRTKTMTHLRAITVDYDNLEFDVSKAMPDRVSIRLEPWNMKREKKFHPMYIAGLFASVDDVGPEDAAVEIKERARRMVNEKVMRSCSESKNNKVVEEKHDFYLNNRHMTLMPIWFFTSSYKGKKYAAVVNGQTGKVVSAVPVFRSAFWGIVAAVTAICYMPMYWIMNFIHTLIKYKEADYAFYVAALLAFGLWYILSKSYSQYIEYKENLLVFQSRDIIKIAERGKKN